MSKTSVYTAFDGDHMVHIDCMRALAIKNNYVPINPEHALGYYLSTRSHHDLKSEVMKDCLALAASADEFWVFTHDENAVLNSLPEGVLIEILMWIRNRNGSIRFFDISKTISSIGLANAPYLGKERIVTESNISATVSEKQFTEMADFLSNVHPCLRPIAFLDIRDEDFKYIDWARAVAYASRKVPISAQHLIPRFVYTTNNLEEQYPASVEKLKELSAEIWAIYHSPEELNALKVAYANCQSQVVFVAIKDLNVPKYKNPRCWSITTKESEEIP